VLDDIEVQIRLFVGLVGAALAAIIGSAARNIYAADGRFRWMRVVIDLPFAITCALVAAGIGVSFNINPIAVNGLAGAFGFLGPQWLHEFLKKRAEDRAAPKDGGGDDKPCP